jgi:hypothetical protein
VIERLSRRRSFRVDRATSPSSGRSERDGVQQLDEDDYLRSKLFAGDRSAMRRYADLVVGPEASYARLARYELVTTLAGRA